MNEYFLADTKVTDDGCVYGYGASVGSPVQKYGARDIACSLKFETSVGVDQESTLIANLEPPRSEALGNFASYPDCSYFAQPTQAGRDSNFHAIDETTLLGSISYLKTVDQKNMRQRSNVDVFVN